MAVSSLARSIASTQDAPRGALDDALMAGMLHDVGKLVLAVNLPKEYRAVMDQAAKTGFPLHQVESERLGLTHAEVGAFLMGLWGMPDPVLEAIAYHHHPADDQHHAFGPLIAVHAADALFNLTMPDPGMPGGETRVDMEYLASLGLNTRMSAWLAVAEKAKEQRG
jgi:HD-like signal output (HDOD) protein